MNFIKNNETINNYRKIFPFVKPYWKRTAIALGLAIPIGCLDAVIALSLKPYMDIVMVEKSMQSPWYIPLLIILFTSTQGLLNYASAYMNDWVTFKVSNDLKKTLYNKLMHKSSNFFDEKTSGEALKRFNNDADLACNGLLGSIKLVISRVFSSISLIGVLIYNSWQLSIIAILMLALAVVPLSRVKSRIKSVTNKSESENAVIITSYNEAYNGSKVIKAFNLYNLQNKKFSQQLDNLFRLKIKITQRTGSISPIMHVIVSVGIGFAIGYGSHLIQTGAISGGNFVSFITALIMLYTPIKGLGGNVKSMQTALLAVERVMKNLEAPLYIIDKKDALEFKNLNTGIQFDNVSFEYKKNKPVLKNISFEVKKGETLALVGNSGGGKSTIVNLIPRFYKIKKGSIKADGIDISDYKIESLRNNIAIVLQDNFLFAGTIEENILMGKPDATKEELNAAIANACLTDFINDLDLGLKTYIGERGVLLSGGQKQRIAIARAFIKNAPIVILDEATSALDNQSEAIVQKAIDNLMKDKTVFVIAHRLSTIKNADRIAVINEGQLVELGNHKELMSIENGQYKALYEMQFKKQEVNN
ncbi:MAG: ABC transporter ATP-binding protein/permease [Candidatus Gastranaerophilales bacterium]|nr:ABC transporter ATP-binding protein/permease [Candidatus Gastranaerophilales bacterium]